MQGGTTAVVASVAGNATAPKLELAALRHENIRLAARPAFEKQVARFRLIDGVLCYMDLENSDDAAEYELGGNLEQMDGIWEFGRVKTYSNSQKEQFELES